MARGDLMPAGSEGVVENGYGDEYERSEGEKARQPSRRHYGNHDVVEGSMRCCLLMYRLWLGFSRGRVYVV